MRLLTVSGRVGYRLSNFKQSALCRWSVPFVFEGRGNNIIQADEIAVEQSRLFERILERFQRLGRVMIIAERQSRLAPVASVFVDRTSATPGNFVAMNTSHHPRRR